MKLPALVLALATLAVTRGQNALSTTEEGDLFEGDIETTYLEVKQAYGQQVADENAKAGMFPLPPADKRGAAGLNIALWPGGKVYYDFDGTLTSQQQSEVRR